MRVFTIIFGLACAAIMAYLLFDLSIKATADAIFYQCSAGDQIILENKETGNKIFCGPVAEEL